MQIKLAQYADVVKNLHFVQYEDESHKYMYLDDPTDEAAQLRAWVQAGNTVGEYVPVISGGVIPVATVMWMGTTRPPYGYLLCDGSEVSRVQYTRLFRAIGTLYGDGDGINTFNLPNLVGRFCRGWGPVSPLDPNRQFGSYQQDELGSHVHTLQPITHTHSITDPGHIHGVTDPGHTHPLVDYGHNHSVLDKGHQHTLTNFSHVGYAGGYSIFVNGGIQFGSGGLFYGYFFYYPNSASANMVVATEPANLILENALSNVTTDTAVTNISIDVGKTNLIETELTGSAETRPDNIALLPVIRF